MAESRFYAPTGFTGAGQAIQALLQQREEEQQRRREFELQRQQQQAAQEIQRRQMAILEENQKMARQKAIDDQADEAAGVIVPTLGAGEVDPAAASLLGESRKYRGLIQHQQTLPSRGMVGALPSPEPMMPGVVGALPEPGPEQPPGVLAPVSDPGGRDFSTVRQSVASQKAQAQTAALARVGDLVNQGVPRKQIVAELMHAGVPVPDRLWDEDPGAKRAADLQDDLAKIDATTAGQLQVARVRAANGGGGDGIDYVAIADAIESGRMAPTINTRSHDGMRVMTELAHRKYDLKTASLDYLATARYFQTVNGNQQTRLRQSVNTAYESLDLIDQLSARWKGGRFPVLNSLNLKAAANGLYGPEVASVATQLDGEIADLTSELANVYQGGNSPTNEAMKLAARSLSADWDARVLRDMTDLARKNLEYRRNSIEQVGALTPTSLSLDNRPPNAPPPNTPPASGGEWMDLGNGVKVRRKPGS